ncbi:MAG: hypothetical protein L0322_32355 [Chloroflexi bacterium]|nr:hypothetical protein [Chloroflexota bacterium]MCI0576981.1 hypothetical protein [Chloroflexota bacterium]MCI0647309.1 hypothetical protein [Chloroflexota bacterium]
MKSDRQLARRIYVILLHLYPADFRRGYADELTLLFVDMHRAAAAQGLRARAQLWLTVLLDLLSSAMRERIRTMLNSRSAAVISLVLCFPLLFVVITASLNYEPPFVQHYLTEPDGYTPTGLARVIMAVMLLSLPAAFVINLMPMFTRARSEETTPFKLTPAHAITGASILLVIMMIFSQQVLYELRPFVNRLGSAAILGQGLCLLGTLSLPVAFLLNRLPRLTKAGSEGALIFQPTSINLIAGAAILLIILMLISTLALEATACSIGVPNCD